MIKLKENLTKLLSSGNMKNILLFISIVKNNNISDSNLYEICKISYSYRGIIRDGRYDVRVYDYFSSIKDIINNY